MANQPTNKPKGIVSKRAGGVISAYRIVKFGADDEHVVQAAADTDKMIGVSLPGSGPDPSGMAEADTILDFATAGICAVEYGGSVTEGDRLTSDAKGRAVTTTTGGKRVIGVAMNGGVIGDVGSVLIQPGTL